MPRTGVLEKVDSYGKYDGHVRMLVPAGLVEDVTKNWWDVRPNATFPILEFLIAKICTRLEDGVTIAALYVCLLSLLRRLRRENHRWRVYSNTLLCENRWLVQRYRYDDGLVDFGCGKRVAYPNLLEKIIELAGEDARELGCLAEVKKAREIVSEGTSAHRHPAVHQEALDVVPTKVKPWWRSSIG